MPAENEICRHPEAPCKECCQHSKPQPKSEWKPGMEAVALVRDALIPIRRHLSCNPGLQDTYELGQMIERALEKIQVDLRALNGKSEERDYTPEEAMEEARRRWGPNGWADFTSSRVLKDVYSVGGDSKYEHGRGVSFRAAFAVADKKESQ